MEAAKFYLIQHAEVVRENVLYAFDTEGERATKTCELMYGHAVPDGDDERSDWAHSVEVLNARGYIGFEGDPGLSWFSAIPV